MTLEEMIVLFESDEDFSEFEKVENPLYPRADICAFLLLDKLLPGGTRDMITSAEHDQIWLDVDCEKLAEVITEEDVRTLRRCGVMYDADSLSMFV